MFKYVFAAIVCIAISFPAETSAQQNGLRQGPVKKLIIGLDKIKCQLGINPAKHCPKGYGTATAPGRVRNNAQSQYFYSSPSASQWSVVPSQSSFGYSSTTSMGQGIITSPGIATQSMTSPSVAAPIMIEPHRTQATPISSSSQSAPIVEAPSTNESILNSEG